MLAERLLSSVDEPVTHVIVWSSVVGGLGTEKCAHQETAWHWVAVLMLHIWPSHINQSIKNICMCTVQSGM